MFNQRLRWLFSKRGMAPLLVLGLASVLSYSLGSHSHPRRLTAQALTVDPRQLDFGEVWVDDDFRWRLPIKNSIDRAIRVGAFATSCRCTQVEPEQLVVPAGGIADVTLTLDLTQGAVGESATATDFTVHISPILQGEITRHPGWTLRGRIRAPLTLSPAFVQYGDGLVRELPFEVRTVVATSNVPLSQLTVQCDRDLAACIVRRRDNTPHIFDIEVHVRDSLPTGPFEFPVHLHATTSAGENLPSMPFVVAGVISDPIQPVPSRIALGTQRVGDKVDQLVVFTSRIDAPFAVEPLAVNAESLRVARATGAPEGQHAFRVSATFDKPGHQDSAVRFVIRTQADDARIIEIPVSAYVVAAPRS